MIVVTGGAGFIGSALIHKLNELGFDDILVVDRLRDADKWKNLRSLKYSEYMHADDLFTYADEDLFSRATFIFHIGACSSTTEKDADYLMSNNVQFSKNMFNWAVGAQIPIVYASSAATYGDGELGYDDDHDTIPKLRPLNPYGYSKQVFDEWVLKNSQKPMHWFGLKFFNVYGPNEYHKGEMRSIVHKAFEQIRQKGFVKLFKSHRKDFEDGKQLRDFIYVKDVVKAMVLMMNPNIASHSGIYNLGTGKARSFDDLVKATFKALGKEEKIEYIDMPENIRDQYQYFTEAKMDKFNNSFEGFEFSSLEDGVTDYVQNYLNSPDPYL